MWKTIALFLIGGVLGVALGFAAGIFVYPYIFLADIVAAETVADRETRPVVARGSFIHANPADPVHYGSGEVTLFEGLVHLEDDFEVGPGPKFHVYLVPKTGITRSADVEGTMYVDLGRLRAFKGSQSFPVPAGVELEQFGSVVIWCERFGVLISPATLDFEAS